MMGGIADYSGALVLQLPISHAAHAALQVRARVRVRGMVRSTARVRLGVTVAPDADIPRRTRSAAGQG